MSFLTNSNLRAQGPFRPLLPYAIKYPFPFPFLHSSHFRGNKTEVAHKNSGYKDPYTKRR